jgi:hypothetical protein
MYQYFQPVKKLAYGMILLLAAASCQKMDRPALGDYTEDPVNPGGTLNFYAAFDGTSANPLLNAVDSIKAAFPSENPLASVDGVSGKALQGENKKFVKYAKPNDWAVKAQSFTVSFWFKRNGQTQNNTGTNGPEHIMSLKSSNTADIGGDMMVFLEGNNTACAVKVYMRVGSADSWLTWEGGNSIAGLLDNNWHHIALVYNASNSTMTLYKDGVANTNTRSWANRGPINLDNSKITEFRVGAGPKDDLNSADWLSSTFKGAIDQLRLYSAALSASEVTNLYNSKL